MKLRTTVTSVLLLLIAIASAVVVILPFVSYPEFSLFNPQMIDVPFYQLLDFKEITISGSFDESLSTLREVSTYVTIIVMGVSGLAFFIFLLRIVFVKNKIVTVINGAITLLLFLAVLLLGVCSVVYGFLWKRVLSESGLLTDEFVITTIGGWVYCALGISIPLILTFTRFIKK